MIGVPNKSAENARICDRECSARDFVRVKFFCARTVGEIVGRDAPVPASDKRVGIFDDRNDQAPIESDGHPEIDIALVNDLVARQPAN